MNNEIKRLELDINHLKDLINKYPKFKYDIEAILFEKIQMLERAKISYENYLIKKENGL